MTTMQKVKSSNIDSIGYNADEKQLLVKFKSGKTFSYKYLTSPEYEALVNADSVGSHFSKFIKGTKACQEVVDTKEKLSDAVDIIIDKDDEIKSLKDRLEFAIAHILMIKRVAESDPIDEEILALATEALEIDKVKSNL